MAANNIVFEAPLEGDRWAIVKYLQLGYSIFVVEPFCAYHHRDGMRFFHPHWPSYIAEFVEKRVVSVLTASSLGSKEIGKYGAEEAVAAVEKVYPFFRNQHIQLVRFLHSVMDDAGVEFLVKRFLCDHLADFFSLNLLLHQIDKVMDSTPYLIYPHSDILAYLDNAQFVSQSGHACHDHPLAVFPQDLLRKSRLTNLLRSVSIAGKIVGQASVSLVAGLFSRRNKKEKKQYTYGISIVAPSRQFRGNQRGVNFLVDGEKIKKDDVVYFPLVPMDNKQEQMLYALGSDVAHLQLRGRFFSNWREWFKLLFVAMTHRPGNNGAIIEMASQALFTFFSWKYLLARINVKHFITHCDFSNAHVSRNIALHQHGVTTWYFTDAINFGSNFRTSDEKWNRHPFWTYLLYDHFITWSKDLASYFTMHPGSMRKTHVVGCLWADHVMPPAEREEFLSELFSTSGEGQTEMFLIVAYASTYGTGGIASFEEGIEFARQLRALVQEIPNLLVLVKEKKDKAMHVTLDPLRGPELLAEYERVDEHPRLVVSTKELDTSLAMAVADLIVSFPFTSPTSEAIGARLPAIWHDPMGNYRETPFSSLGGVVSHSYEELRDTVHAAMAREPDGLHISPENKTLFDPFRDGHAIDRFRELLQTLE